MHFKVQFGNKQIILYKDTKYINTRHIDPLSVTYIKDPFYFHFARAIQIPMFTFSPHQRHCETLYSSHFLSPPFEI